MSEYHLGLNLGHDRAAALVRDGKIVVAIHQERLDRLKHSLGFLHQDCHDPAKIQLPHEAIQYCLKSCGIQLADVATISANMPGVDQGSAILQRSLPPEFMEKILTPPSHHRMHAYSAYWPSGFEEALVFVVDASGSSHEGMTESYTLSTACGEKIRTLHEERVPSHLATLSTLGFVYEYVSRKAGFVTQVGSIHIPEAGKLMGLAAYGGPQDHWQRWIRPCPESYHLDISPYEIFLEIAALEKRYDDGQGEPYLRPYLVDLAWKVQHELEQALLHIVGRAVKETGLRRLCLAGGVTLNSVANYKLLRELDLEDIFIFPAAGDAGIAAGCALWAYAEHEGGRRRERLRHAALGHAWDEESLGQALEPYADQIQVEQLPEEQVVVQTAEALAKGYVVARFEGGSEFGPRALGARSILADPTFRQMKDILNARVKFREPFRPFAPVIPAEEIAEVFEQEVPSPFMLVVSQIKSEYHEQIPAVTHCDGSGRVQTVTAEDNPFFHRLCRQMGVLREGPPIILNTSFNIAGQPIVETPEEAIQTFLDTNIDYLFLENYRITKRDVPVLDYEHHLAKVNDAVLPQGLPGAQEAVTGLMRQLDRALFFGEAESCPWTMEELRTLSREGALFKETSREFSDSPYGRLLHSRLSPTVALLLDPLNGSHLVETSAHDQALLLSWPEVGLLQALLKGDRPLLERLRLERQCTTQAWARQIATMAGQLRGFSLAPQKAHPGDIGPPAREMELPGPVQLTLEPFVDEDFQLCSTLALLRTLLDTAGYDETAICTLLGLDSLQCIEPTHLHYYDRFQLAETPLADLVRLFLLRVALPGARLRSLFGEELFNTLSSLGLFYPCGERWASRVDLYSVEGLYLVTDHRYMLDEEDRLTETPVMYIGLDSRGLVHAAPRRPCAKLLDLCTGSGVQALSGSRYATEAVGVDLNPRAVRFARFNAQLNGIHNVRFLQGDLYDSFQHETFDIILANPPFVPSPYSELRYRDGGCTGERVLGRIIGEAAAYMNPGGQLHIVSDLVDIDGYGAKLHRWWQGGPSHQLVLGTADRDEILFSVPHSHAPFGQSFAAYNAELETWLRNYQDAGIKAVNFGYIFINTLASGEDGSYFYRVIHNPLRPIHQEVASYFRQRQRFADYNTGKNTRLSLRLRPGLRFRVEFDPAGGGQQVELYVPDNPYFTTYLVNEAVYQELQYINHYQPCLEVFTDKVQRSRISELVLKGVLELAEPGLRRGNVSGGGRGIFPGPGLGPRVFAQPDGEQPPLDIRELETKTTPTCLSSYLT
ncbi:carbamoyltransferase C-terminal domain-containing protein [Desulfogranum mediterraneum]|uniref:carbamoyltransferase C-terminal domain-containing protein n=1 Tax=Desulfogranum mediterraneum TaxID=160661 RepID=UPI00040D39AB|nr:carbamoyltransferase C-terminal domain-containing protein [Desulfogranum mediterraneum]